MAVSFKCTACGHGWPAEPILAAGGVKGVFSYLGAVVYPVTCPGCGATYDHPSGQVVRPNGKGNTLIPALHFKRKGERRKMRHPHISEGEAAALARGREI